MNAVWIIGGGAFMGDLDIMTPSAGGWRHPRFMHQLLHPSVAIDAGEPGMNRLWKGVGWEDRHRHDLTSDLAGDRGIQVAIKAILVGKGLSRPSGCRGDAKEQKEKNESYMRQGCSKAG